MLNGNAARAVCDASRRGPLRRFVSALVVLVAPTLLAQTVEFSRPRFSVDEFVGPALVTVVRMGNTSGSSSVTYTAAPALAVAPADFVPVTATLTFNPGETSKTFNVTVYDDQFWEDAESIDLSLSNPVGGTLGAQSTAKLWIHPSESPMGMNADFNGDGTFEILWRNLQTGTMLFWYLDANGTGVVGSGPAITVDPGFRIAAVDRFDYQATQGGDLFADIVFHDGTTGVIDIWVMESGQMIRHKTYYGMPYPWQIVSSTDVNRDGNPDLTWRNMETGVMFSWLMNQENVVRGTAARQTNPAVRIADEFCYDGAAGYFEYGCAGEDAHAGLSRIGRGPAIHTMGHPWDIVSVWGFNVMVWWRNKVDGRMVGWRNVQGTVGTGLITVDPSFKLGAIGNLSNASPDQDMVWYNPETGVTDIWIMNTDNVSLYLHQDYVSFQWPWDIIAPNWGFNLSQH